MKSVENNVNMNMSSFKFCLGKKKKIIFAAEKWSIFISVVCWIGSFSVAMLARPARDQYIWGIDIMYSVMFNVFDRLCIW